MNIFVASNDDALQFFSKDDLTNAPEVTEAQALVNRALGKGPRRPRKERRGLLNVSEATFDRWLASGEFPHPVKFGPRMNRWSRRVVLEWLEQQSTTV